MALINTMEDVVKAKIEELVKDSDCCKCEKCLEDMQCLALNALPAKYVTTSKGELFSRLSHASVKQRFVDLDIACLNAIEFVKAHPKHDDVQKQDAARNNENAG